MKYILLMFMLILELCASVVQSPIVSVEGNTATIKIEKIDVGMSGFVVHHLPEGHTSILKNVVVKSFDSESKIATLEMSDYTGLFNNALPTGRWHVEIGDTVILAFAYDRGLLIAPNEEIYHRITISAKALQWIHPDIFATILSFNGHRTPMKNDFEQLSNSVSVGLLFFYLDKKLYMVDSKSFSILTITDADLVQDSMQLPFYRRVPELEALWFGEGSSEIEDYEPYYYELLFTYNRENKQLLENIKAQSPKYEKLLKKLESKE